MIPLHRANSLNNLESEPFVRHALSLLEAAHRELALRALADWQRLGISAPSLYSAIAALQRPSWGHWNGLLFALRETRKHLLRSGSVSDREQVKRADELNRILDRLEEEAPTCLIAELRPLAQLAGNSLSGRPRWAAVLALPIALRNLVAHATPAEQDWWQAAAEALRPMLALHMRGDLQLAGEVDGSYPEPWFVRHLQTGERCDFNGLRDDAVLYVTPDGEPSFSTTMLPPLLLTLQHLLGKAGIQEGNFKRLLARLAPEQLKGVLLGDYLVGPPVGSGGYATVHVGTQLSTGRKVAVKILNDGLDEAARARFQQEAVYLSRLNHPHIVGVIGCGEDPWRPPREPHVASSLAAESWFQTFSHSSAVKSYIALEWIDGPSLEEFFQGTEGIRPTLQHWTTWFADAASALGTVHAAGLVHRDVKPANLMVTKQGILKLMDFGIARTQGELRTVRTTPGRALGTPAYMAPEQVLAHRVDEVGPACDVYGLCASFYELITSVRLFRHDRETEQAVTTRKVQGERPERPRAHNKQLPWEVEVILMGGLEPDVADRYRSMAELENDLRRFIRREPIEYRRPSYLRRFHLWCRRSPALALSSTVAALALFGVTLISLAFFFYERNTSASLAQQSDDLRDKNVDLVREKSQSEALLRDSRRQAAILALDRGMNLGNEGDARRGIHWLIRSLDSAVAAKDVELERYLRTNLAAWCRQIVPLRSLFDVDFDMTPPQFSPDGRAIAAANEKAARLWDLATGQPLGPLLPHKDLAVFAIHPEGKTLATGGRDHTVQVWEPTSGRRLASIVVAGTVTALTYAPDGSLLAVGYDVPTQELLEFNGAVRLCDATTGKFRGDPLPQEGQIQAVTFNAGGQTLLVRCEKLRRKESQAQLWDVHSGQIIGAAISHQDECNAAVFSPNGDKLLTTGPSEQMGKGEFRFWDARTAQALGKAVEYEGKVTAVRFLPAGKQVLVVNDKQAFIWDTEKSTVAPVAEHQDTIAALTSTPDTSLLLTGSLDGTAQLWETQGRGKSVGESLEHRREVETVAFHPDGSHLMTASRDGRVYVWRHRPARHVEATLPEYSSYQGPARLSPDGRVILVRKHLRQEEENRLGVAWLCLAATGQIIGEPIQHQAIIEAVAFSPNSRLAATGSQDKTVRLWDTTTGQQHGPTLEHDRPVRALTFTADGRTLLVAAGALHQWDVATGQPAGPTLVPPKPPITERKDLQILFPEPAEATVYSFAVSPDGKYVVLDGAALQLWERTTGKPTGRCFPHPEPGAQANPQASKGHGYRATFSPNGQVLLTEGYDHGFQLWDVATGQPIGKVLELPGDMHEVAFSPDSATLVIGYWDSKRHTGGIRLWAAATGKPLGPPLLHNDGVRAVAFSPDCRTVMSGSSDDTVRLWDVATCRQLGPPIRVGYMVNLVAFSPDGKEIIAECGTMHTLPTPLPMQGTPAELRLWAEIVTGMELDAGGGINWLDTPAWRQRQQQWLQLGISIPEEPTMTAPLQERRPRLKPQEPVPPPRLTGKAARLAGNSWTTAPRESPSMWNAIANACWLSSAPRAEATSPRSRRLIHLPISACPALKPN